MTITSWLRARRGAASTVILSVLASGTLGAAVLHRGFPVADVDLTARAVWVTNGEQLLAGRLNRQIEELDGAVNAASNAFDVLQDGEDVFLHDASVGSVERVDPAFTTLVQRVDVPPGSQVAFGGHTLAVLSPAGELWVTDAAGELALSTVDAEPVAGLGEGSRLVVSRSGVTFATSPDQRVLARVAQGETIATTSPLPAIGDHELSAVGDVPVVLDREANAIVVDGEPHALDEVALRIQQPGDEHDAVLLATGTGLVEVPLDGGDATSVDAGLDVPATTPAEASAPVRLDGCAHGAWAVAQAYLLACDGRADRYRIAQPTAGSALEFRRNRDVIALNNLSNGDAWLVDSDLRLVDNWEEVTPPVEYDDEEGDETSSTQSFEDTLADRTDVNRPPNARDDELGVRPGRATILEVLENDTDPDGDVLTIAGTSEIPESAGRLEHIDGSRALQFTPAPGASGTVSFRYTVDDGRLGVAEAQVDVTVRPTGENLPPVPHREAAVSVEQGRSISYHVLADWNDPDGDDLYLVNASPTSGDSVRFGPDGYVTFEHRTGEIGLKEVQYVVSDGAATATGTLTVDVRPTGSLNPVGTPDHAQVFAGERVLLEPLANDLSPSGAPLVLLGVAEVEGADATANTELGTVAFSANEVGSHLFTYDLAAGDAVSVGLIRVDVLEAPEQALPPIAVTDTAYLRAGEPTSVPLLANDASPNGRVLAVQSVELGEIDDLVTVELLGNAVARITASAALTEPLQFGYTVSDGSATAEASVAVVPVPPLVKHQPPIAVPDTATVRAGDIATVAVTANDVHPDSAPFHVLPDLAESPEAGLAFVTGDTVRFQAPDEPGTHRVSYTIADGFDETATASVTFVVTPAGDDAAPLPAPITARTFAGSTVEVEVPLDGIDPDGDSVLLRGVTSPPSLGRVVESISTGFTYEAFAGSTGTDAFEYEVVDTSGEVATGTVRIGVIPRPEVTPPPNAVDDVVELRPGRTGSIDVLGNDSDPSGYPIRVDEQLANVDLALEAEVRANRVVVTAPEREGGFSLRYEITNGHGGADAAYVQVKVTEDARIDPPSAEDQVIEPEDVLGVDTVTVHPLDDAQNPGGLVEDLVVTLEGPNAGSGTVLPNGAIVVTPSTERQAVAYRLTNDVDDLSAMAFVIVPPVPDPDALAADDEPDEEQFPLPYLAEIGEQFVRMNGSVSWSLADVVVVPSGRPIEVLSASATNADGSPVLADAATLAFAPATDYRGQASVTFQVTDAAGTAEQAERTAFLTIPVTVGSADFTDVPPTFTPRTVQLEAGEEPVQVDLRDSSGHPNPDVLARLAYGGLSGGTAEIVPALEGSILTLTAPLGVQPGTSATLSFTLGFDEFTVPGSIEVQVVSSSRPTPEAVDDQVEMTRAQVQRVDVLANDFDPFAPEALRIVDARIDQASVGSNASVAFTGQDVSVTTGAAFTGTLSVVYRIQDATRDPARETQGRLTVVVRDAPDAPATPATSPGDGSATVRWQAPATNNSPITGYTVHWTGGGSRSFGAGAAGTDQTIGGLSNGSSVQFWVTATNAIGTSAASPKSSAIVPYGVPTAPRNVTLNASQTGNARLNMSWTAPADDGGRAVTEYRWRFTEGSSASGTTTSRSDAITGSNGTRYRYEVRACNARGCGPWAASNRDTPTAPPPPEPGGTIFKGGLSTVACSGCRYVGIDYHDFPAGSYRITTFINGSNGGLTENTYSMGTDGSIVIWNSLGIRNDDRIQVRFTRTSNGAVYWSDAITNWDSLPIRGGTP
ncbi:fibronectin type III [Agromyces rhizosphaerae]|uniref:Fibronectin type III n=1 Tax=Agromyces rhizosphaerae TaxID=88374 RepID=A0A9W6CUB7_9MICO|nr:Ig-like domain-containing protein [Agromyces rhizosphaerae]GLI28618.1 fibronectin type III [Agromyces rhizosphaerae]